MKSTTRLLITLCLPSLALILPALVAADANITVCVSGPPACDYASIQAAIDAANFGDTVVVSAGTYTEQLMLKSGVSVTSTDGPTSTIVMATSGPIVLAEAVTTTQLSGFTLDGSAIVTPAIGLLIVDSEITLANSHIQHMHGLTGTGTITGGNAIGLYITGTFSAMIEQVVIDDIQGGNASPDSYADGGSATGITAVGNGQLSITATQIRTITGGNASLNFYGAYYCPYSGGDSVGISKQGSATLSLTEVSVTQLVGGHPCHAASWYCIFNAGQAIGVNAVSGTLNVRHTTVSDLTWNASWSSSGNTPHVIGYGIRSQATDETRIEDTHILSLTTLPVPAPYLAVAYQPQSPSCGPTPGTGIGVSLEDGHRASVEYNIVSDIAGAGTGGLTTGIQSRNTANLMLSHNQITRLRSGSIWVSYNLPQAAGIRVDTAQHVEISNNQIDHVHGGQGEEQAYGFVSYGANATGLYVDSISTTTILNNLIFGITGGDGANYQSPWPQEPADAGFGRGIQLVQSTGQIQNNTLYAVGGGAAGFPVGQLGQGIGIDLGAGTSALILNNAIISSTIGVTATPGAYLWDYNALWQSTLDYSGIVTGPHDLHIDPRFIDATHGDFHLAFSSLLIDRGFTPLSPPDDLDGNPRPIDGNGDGVPVTDIGAYEYQPVPLYKTYLPTLRRS